LSTYPSLTRGTAAWLYNLINGQLTDINAELTASVVSTATAPQFALQMGDPQNVSSPTICITHAGTVRSQAAQHNYNLTPSFRIIVLIPQSGDNTPENFEMARQVAADHLSMLLTDETVSLAPLINAGSLGNLRAQRASWSNLIDIFPRKMANSVTVVRGFELQLAVAFSLQSSS
jgi:hypothetical protein